MKYFIFLILLISTNVFAFPFYNLADSSIQKESNRILTYTFENADSYVKENDLNKAIWIYINLYPKDSTKVVECMNNIKSSFPKEIKWTIFNGFGLNWMSDPEIFDGKGGVDAVNMKRKGKWADDLIRALENYGK